MNTLGYVQHSHVYSEKKRIYYKSVIESVGGTLVIISLTERYIPNVVLPHAITQYTLVYVFDTHVNTELQKELLHYFTEIGAKHMYSEHVHIEPLIHGIFTNTDAFRYTMNKKVPIDQEIASVWRICRAPLIIEQGKEKCTVTTFSELERILHTFHIKKGEIYIQSYIKGVEYEVSVTKNTRGKEIYTAPVVRMHAGVASHSVNYETKKALESALFHISKALPQVSHITCRIIESGNTLYVTSVSTNPYSDRGELTPSLIYVGLGEEEVTKTILEHALLE